MADNDRKPSKERRYPEFYEKVIPIALGVIIVAIVVVLVIAIAIALRLFPAAGS